MATKKSGAKKKGMTGMQAAELGAGVLAAAAAAGAGYYYFGSKDAKKHRAAAEKWAKDMKKEVVKQAKKVKKLDEQAMAVIVDQTMKAYQSAKNITPADLKAAGEELKGNWMMVQKELRRTAAVAKRAPKKAVTAAKKAINKAAKKVVKKTAPKKAAKKAAKKR